MNELYFICDYYIKWVSRTHQYIYLAGDELDNLIAIVERIYQKKPRMQEKPKIVCNTTGRVVYE
jgi:hypothetical protein